MALVLPAIVVTGTVIESAWGNSVRTAFTESATYKVTTAGDIPYGTADKTIARLPKGTAGQWLRMNAGATAPEWSNGLRSGGAATEATTTSTSNVDPFIEAVVSIPATSLILITCNIRKSAGAAAAGRFGLRINATTVLATSSFIAFTATNQAENGFLRIWLPPRVTNYLRAGHIQAVTGPAAGGTVRVHDHYLETADAPTTTITGLTLMALSDNALVTIGADELNIYEFAGA